ncbi:hypothetical protein HPP92_019921 [Vanilla planifolia]|uniref:protein-serine/threonine phosphatase n=1 Tax=Vanilla planifolia TaxID=51239 RepID=A0A835UL75_VANPL|nr:hypothetical protein HPP92_019921 [Vanilla planifolia]
MVIMVKKPVIWLPNFYWIIFLLHVNFLRDGIYSMAIKKSPEKLTYNEEQDALIEVTRFDNEESWQKLGDKRSEWISSTIFDESFHLEVLKESLLRTIHDIDVAFSKEALRFSYDAGSTATVSLIADGRILTANVGDSKSFLCSEKFESLPENGIRSRLSKRRRHNGAVSKRFELANYGGLRYYAKELTKDHHPSREDERDRVEAAGGHIVEWAGVHRVNGQLALSRAIGDLPFKRYGVISVPEVTDWQHVSKNDSFLIAASDGVFEKMTTQEVCEVLWNEKPGKSMMPSCMHSLSSSCADCIVNTAFERGSMDNLAAVVVPLGFTGVSDSIRQDKFDGADYSSYGLQNVIKQHARLQDTMNHQAGNLPCE